MAGEKLDILAAIERFYECTGSYPGEITVLLNDGSAERGQLFVDPRGFHLAKSLNLVELRTGNQSVYVDPLKVVKFNLAPK